jgi:ParB/RepB/Spo0J family partition protein
MRFKASEIALAQVDATDRTFRITTRTDIGDLTASIRQVGLLNPPILIKKKKDYLVIAGFRRIAACMELNWPAIPACILPADTTDYECAQIAVSGNALERPLNLIEQSRAFGLLATYGVDDSGFSATAVVLGLPGNPVVIEKIKRLAVLDPVIQDAVLTGALSLAMALELAELDRATGSFLAGLFDDLKLGLNKQREFVTLVREIAKRENVPMRSILEEDPIRATCNAKDLDRVQKTRALRTHLRQRRYPAISDAENFFKHHLKKLKMGSHITLDPPRDFEGPDFTLRASMRCPGDLDALLSTLNRIRQHPSLQAIFEKELNPD